MLGEAMVWLARTPVPNRLHKLAPPPGEAFGERLVRPNRAWLRHCTADFATRHGSAEGIASAATLGRASHDVQGDTEWRATGRSTVALIRPCTRRCMVVRTVRVDHRRRLSARLTPTLTNRTHAA